ncbi:sigma-70 family RNA polymerase sigma factor [Mycolicibacterium llatzerense]|uniref:sigma-70 family RNA polymerase sigma factor n=1 Tax=Mycolicibacterium llatzerense TaxID=280871 RepID=UPI0008DDDF43|nr:sigma-70 family RNA polymerase sigma factor [Mycolicibacterium llatzerense]
MAFVFQNIGDDWTVEMQWKAGDYEGGPAAIWIHPVDPDNPPSGGLSSTVLRSINFRAAKDKLVSDLAAESRGSRTRAAKQAEREEQAVEQLRHQLAKGITPEYLALLSSNYVRRVTSGQPKPVEQIAADLGKPLQTVRGHLWQARKQGLLTGSAGRKGGDLTVEAMTILQRMSASEKPKKRPSLIHDDPPAGAEDATDR